MKLTVDELMALDEEELRKRMIEKVKNGHYTPEATACYYALQRKKAQEQPRTEIRAAKTCGKYAADCDYYGWPDVDGGGFYDYAGEDD